MKLYYDLHIHSILSPCADELMTPNNLLNMAMLKGLDIVAVTDHNSGKQLPTIKELENSYDFLFVPGVEVTVREGFDVLCYFRSYIEAQTFDQFLEQYLLDDWEIYTKSDQVITNVYDEEVDLVDKPLTKTSLSYHDLAQKVRSLDGCLVIAHIDRPSQSPLPAIDLSTLDFDAIELQGGLETSFTKEHPELTTYRILFNSDAHSLPMISEKEHFLDLPEKTIDAFFAYLRGDD